ncbi:MAG: SPFH domain-containing protein, partial [Gammaproteobacteria bacterium]|nr:SPFH domain-containing protein [Gammaproteobacteria bacterium]
MSAPAFAVFLICVAVGAALAVAAGGVWPLIVFVPVGAYLLFALKVAMQWEKVAVLRLGKYRGLRGPGMFMIIPVVDTLSDFVDQRIRVTDVQAESTLTRDAVPVYVDAIVFWLVWNAEKSVLEVEDFFDAITMSAQTALRESIG